MLEFLNFLASIAWYGWITIALIWMFIGLGFAELQVMCADRDISTSKSGDDRYYHLKAHKIRPLTYLAFPRIALFGSSSSCEARYHDSEPFHVRMAFKGVVVLMFNIVFLATVCSLRLLLLSGKGLIWLLCQPWKKLFASDMAKPADEPKPRQVAPKEQPKKIDVKYLN